MKSFDNIETKIVSKAVTNNVSNIKPGQLKTTALQTRLKIGKPDDEYEQEADRVAEQVMSMPAHQTIRPTGNTVNEEETVQMKLWNVSKTPWIQTQLEEEEELLQTKPNDHTPPEPISNQAQSKINSTKGLGGLLPDDTKSFMESRFDSDFSNVRIHNNADAFQLNRELVAQAFTVGNDIYFNSGKYNPDNASGKHLLAHELTHVVQQQDEIFRSPSLEGIKFVRQIDFTAKVKDIEYGKTKSDLVPFSLLNKIKKALKDSNLSNQSFWIEMAASVYNCNKKAAIDFEPGVRYVYTLSGRFSGNEINWIRIIMHKPTSMQYDWGEVIVSSSEEIESEEHEEDIIFEEIEAKLESAGNDIEKLDAWLHLAEFALEGESAEKMAGLRKRLGHLTDSLSSAIDIKNKTVAGAKLVASFQQALNVKPGSSGGVKAASGILYALGEFGQEIPILGGALDGYLEFFKAPETMRKLGQSLVDLHHRRMKRALTGK